MTGRVDAAGRAILGVTIVADAFPNGVTIDVWIDTGFTGEIVFPIEEIRRLGLVQSGSVDAVLADGSLTQLGTYSCKASWFNGIRNIEVIANEGQFPLLGIGLLLGRELRIDYTNLTLSVLPVPRATS